MRTKVVTLTDEQIEELWVNKGNPFLICRLASDMTGHKVTAIFRLYTHKSDRGEPTNHFEISYKD